MKNLKDMNKKEVKELDSFIRETCAKDKKEKFNKFAILLNIIILIFGLGYALHSISCEGFTISNKTILLLVIVIPVLMIKHFRYKLWENRESMMLEILDKKNKNKKKLD